MASVEECEAAFGQLADRLAAASSAGAKRTPFDRSLSCSLTDLSVIFAGRLHDGRLLDVHQAEDATAQIRMRLSSDDLVKLVNGDLAMGTAWAGGRIKVDASVMDLLRLRSVF